MGDALTEPGVHRWGAAVGQTRLAAICLHGRGRTPDDVLTLAARIALPEIAFVAPAAPNGTWYPEGFMAPLARNQPHLDQALARVDALVDALATAGHPARHTVLVGFSQGACLAAEYAFRHPKRWGALVAFTGGLIGAPGELRGPSGDLAGTPVLLATADPDAWVPVERVRETAVVFRAMKGSVDERIYPGLDHAVSDDEISAARALLSAVLTSTAADR